MVPRALLLHGNRRRHLGIGRIRQRCARHALRRRPVRIGVGLIVPIAGDVRPTIIPARPYQVDLVVCIRPVLGLVQLPVRREDEPLRVAMAVGVDVAPDAAERRVVGWNRSVEIQPQDFPYVERPVTLVHLRDGRQNLCAIRVAEVGQLIGAEIADREVQLPIRADDKPPALMIRAGWQAGEDIFRAAERVRTRIVGEANDLRPGADRFRIGVAVVGVGDIDVSFPVPFSSPGSSAMPSSPPGPSARTSPIAIATVFDPSDGRTRVTRPAVRSVIHK